jgi:hypothetical protein
MTDTPTSDPRSGDTRTGDTMPVLQAVLDTQFWLATHVITITLGYAATAFASILSSILVDQPATWSAIDRIVAPVLVLWGDQDPLVERSLLDAVLGRRPDWDLHVFEGAGHGAPGGARGGPRGGGRRGAAAPAPPQTPAPAEVGGGGAAAPADPPPPPTTKNMASG